MTRQNSSSRALAVLIGLLLALAVACGTKTKIRHYQCAIGPQDAAPDPQEIWQCHRDIMRRAARGKKFTVREFDEASRFFGELTSIDAEQIPTKYGPLPSKELKQRIAQWDDWYDANGSELYWDAGARTVRVASGKR